MNTMQIQFVQPTIVAIGLVALVFISPTNAQSLFSKIPSKATTVVFSGKGTNSEPGDGQGEFNYKLTVRWWPEKIKTVKYWAIEIESKFDSGLHTVSKYLLLEADFFEGAVKAENIVEAWRYRNPPERKKIPPGPNKIDPTKVGVDSLEFEFANSFFPSLNSFFPSLEKVKLLDDESIEIGGEALLCKKISAQQTLKGAGSFKYHNNYTYYTNDSSPIGTVKIKTTTDVTDEKGGRFITRWEEVNTLEKVNDGAESTIDKMRAEQNKKQDDED